MVRNWEAGAHPWCVWFFCPCRSCSWRSARCRIRQVVDGNHRMARKLHRHLLQSRSLRSWLKDPRQRSWSSGLHVQRRYLRDKLRFRHCSLRRVYLSFWISGMLRPRSQSMGSKRFAWPSKLCWSFRRARLIGAQDIPSICWRLSKCYHCQGWCRDSFACDLRLFVLWKILTELALLWMACLGTKSV